MTPICVILFGPFCFFFSSNQSESGIFGCSTRSDHWGKLNAQLSALIVFILQKKAFMSDLIKSFKGPVLFFVNGSLLQRHLLTFCINSISTFYKNKKVFMWQFLFFAHFYL